MKPLAAAKILGPPDPPIGPAADTLVTEELQGKNRQQLVVSEPVVTESQHEGRNTDFGHLAVLRTTEGVLIHLADAVSLELRLASLDFHAAVHQRAHPLVVVAGNRDHDLAGSSGALFRSGLALAERLTRRQHGTGQQTGLEKSTA